MAKTLLSKESIVKSVGGASNAYKFKLEVIENSTDVSKNTSNVTIKHYGACYSSSWGYSGFSAPKSTIGIDNTEKASANVTSINSTSYKLLSSWTGNITHSADGTKKINVKAKYGPAETSYLPTPNEMTGTVTLTTIPRKSGISATDSFIEDICKITINSASKDFKHTLKFNFSGSSGGESGTIAKNVETSYNWPIPKSFYSAIPDEKSADCEITCETYSGSTKIGETSTTIKISCDPSLCSPTISLEAIDTNTTTVALTGSNIKFVKGYSNAKVTPTAKALNSATVKKIVINGSTVTGAITINNIANNTITASVTDSRGFTNSARIVLTMINYVPLTCKLNAKRANPTSDKITLEISGNYFNSTFGATSNTLALTYKWREKNKTWSSAISVTATKKGNTYSATITPTVSFNYQKDYQFIVYAQDKLVSINSGTKTVTRGLAPFEIYQECIKVNGIPFWAETILTANTDLDNYIKPGIYFFGADYTPANIPKGVNGWLIVFPIAHGQYVKQLWFRLGTPGVNSFDTFERSKGADGWSKWIKYPTDKDFYYEPGDTYAATNQHYYCGGHITGSNGNITFDIQLPKKLDNVTVELVSGKATFRGVNGYIDNANGGIDFKGTGMTVTLYKRHANRLTIRVAKSGGFTNATNNTPVAVEFSSFSFKFN